MSLKRNTAWNLIGVALPLALGAITIPYLLEKIGVESFGVLTLVWALIGYFSLFDFGLGRALTQQVASARAADQLSTLPDLIKTGLFLAAATGAVGGVLLASTSNLLGFHWLNVSPSLQESTTHALLIASIGIPLTTITSGLRGVLEAYEDFKTVNILRIALGLANFGLPALSVFLISDSLPLMVGGLMVARAFALAAHAVFVSRTLPRSLGSGRMSHKKLKGLLSFGAWMTLSNVASPLMVTADRFVISSMLGASVVAYYTVPFEILIRVLLLPAALTSVLFPRLTAVMINDKPAARLLYRRSLKVVTLTLFPICLIIAICSNWGLSFWLGTEFAEHSWRVVTIMALGLFLNGVAYVPYAAIQAAGDARTTAQLHLLELTLYVPILYIGIYHFGLFGAAAAWVSRVAFDLIALLLRAKYLKL